MANQWQISTLANGMRVVTTPVPTAQSVSVNVFFGVGSRSETPRTNGVSHYIEHMLFKGTERRPDAILIAEAIEGAGGVLNAYTSKELTCYWNQVPFDKLALADRRARGHVPQLAARRGGDRPRADGGAAGAAAHVRPAGRLGVGAARAGDVRRPADRLADRRHDRDRRGAAARRLRRAHADATTRRRTRC